MNEFITGLLTPEYVRILITVVAGFTLSVCVSFWSEYIRLLGPKAARWQLALTVALNHAAGNPFYAKQAKIKLKKDSCDE